MNQQEMIQSLRAEIAKLQGVIDLLLDEPSVAEGVRRPGRRKGSGTRATSFNPEEFAPKKRTMSAEGKARIAAAQKKRWAEQKGLAAGRGTRRAAAPTTRTSKAVSPKSAGKVVPATSKKSTGAGKRKTQPGSQIQSAKRAAAVVKKSAGKKSVAKKSTAKKSVTKGASKLASKRPVKQVTTAAPEAPASE